MTTFQLNILFYSTSNFFTQSNYTSASPVQFGGAPGSVQGTTGPGTPGTGGPSGTSGGPGSMMNSGGETIVNCET